MTKTKTAPRGFFASRRVRLRKTLLAWYDAHARALPWREDHDAYRVWISEIMLQQTRVAAVIEHYHEFLRRFPTVQKLAAARQSSVLAAWSGLGYYRRARMMHAAARVLVREYGGKFPRSAEELRELPGIGRYTAAAIASIAFGEAVAVVDGNVERVLQRLLGQRLAGDELWLAAEELLDAKRPGDFNQAMMELGAVTCTPRAPGCLTCPVMKFCATRGELSTLSRPERQQKREMHYALVLRKNGRGTYVFLVRRPATASLMSNMWELPEVAGADRESSPYLTLRHSITTTDYKVSVWRESWSSADQDGKWVALDRVKRVALTGLARKILAKAALMGCELSNDFLSHGPTARSSKDLLPGKVI